MDISIKVTYKSEGLQKLRKAAGLSQSQLADLAGIKVQVLQQYERGARDINGAKLPTLLKICNALECRPPLFFYHGGEHNGTALEPSDADQAHPARRLHPRRNEADGHRQGARRPSYDHLPGAEAVHL